MFRIIVNSQVCKERKLKLHNSFIFLQMFKKLVALQFFKLQRGLNAEYNTVMLLDCAYKNKCSIHSTEYWLRIETDEDSREK